MFDSDTLIKAFNAKVGSHQISIKSPTISDSNGNYYQRADDIDPDGREARKVYMRRLYSSNGDE